MRDEPGSRLALAAVELLHALEHFVVGELGQGGKDLSIHALFIHPCLRAAGAAYRGAGARRDDLRRHLRCLRGTRRPSARLTAGSDRVRGMARKCAG